MLASGTLSSGYALTRALLQPCLYKLFWKPRPINEKKPDHNDAARRRREWQHAENGTQPVAYEI